MHYLSQVTNCGANWPYLYSFLSSKIIDNLIIGTGNAVEGLATPKLATHLRSWLYKPHAEITKSGGLTH